MSHSGQKKLTSWPLSTGKELAASAQRAHADRATFDSHALASDGILALAHHRLPAAAFELRVVAISQYDQLD